MALVYRSRSYAVESVTDFIKNVIVPCTIIIYYKSSDYAFNCVTSTVVEYGLRLFHPTLDKAC
jgi:hypothetical protein